MPSFLNEQIRSIGGSPEIASLHLVRYYEIRYQLAIAQLPFRPRQAPLATAGADATMGSEGVRTVELILAYGGPLERSGPQAVFRLDGKAAAGPSRGPRFPYFPRPDGCSAHELGLARFGRRGERRCGTLLRQNQ